MTHILKLKYKIKNWNFCIIYKMVGTLIKSVGLLLVSYFAFWFIFGWPNNGVKDIVASKMLFGEESNSIEMLKEGYKSELKNYNNEIFNFEFEALGEFGVRRSSNVIGQAFDFLRFSGIIFVSKYLIYR